MTDPIDTPATRAATAAGIAFWPIRTARPSSAEESAALQGISLHQLLRTIVIRRGTEDYVFVLVPGGRQIDWPKLRAHLAVNRLSLPDKDEAKDATGYERGTITPFGARTAWPVIADATIEGLVAIGGGAHGVHMHLEAADLFRVLGAAAVDVTSPAGASARAPGAAHPTVTPPP